MNIAIVQPRIAHYRSEFYESLRKKLDLCDVYVFMKNKVSSKEAIKVDNFGTKYIKNISLGSVLWYNPFTLWSKKYDILVLMWQQGHLSTWFLLLTKWFHRKKIVLWGQGISVRRYMKEEKKPNRLMRWMLGIADGAWLYMDKEYEQWHAIFPHKPMVALQNSLTGVDDMISYKSDFSKFQLKQKYNINQDRIFIFSARFSHNYRRTDLLEGIIQRLNKTENGFIIIGDGPFKPDLSKYNNVYEFGALYDTTIKRELFSIADLYLQPGWVGLSIVEAMAYGKPICTFERSEQTLQCVEYDYIKDNWNGMIFQDFDDCMDKLTNLSEQTIKMMSENARSTARNSSPHNMAERALSVVYKL